MACRVVLPARENLSRKGIGASQWCPVCGEGVESVVHKLVLYPAARVSWFSSPLGLRSEAIIENFFCLIW